MAVEWDANTSEIFWFLDRRLGLDLRMDYMDWLGLSVYSFNRILKDGIDVLYFMPLQCLNGYTSCASVHCTECVMEKV